MAQIDNDGRTELQNRVRNPLNHLYDKLSNLTIKVFHIHIDKFSVVGLDNPSISLRYL